MKMLALVAVLSLCGCAAVNVTHTDTNGNRETYRAFVPAWPWQNSNQTIAKSVIRSSPTNYLFSQTGLNEQQTGDTNFWAGVSQITGAAVAAGVHAAKTP
jgi:hypothetical protein